MNATFESRLNGILSSLAVKAPVRLATTGNITLSGLQEIDGETTLEGDFVLVKSQATVTENGIYIAAEGVWLRRADFDGPRDCVAGTSMFVSEGSLNGDAYWKVVTTAAEPVVGTDTITFEKVQLQSALDLAASEAARDIAVQAASDAQDAADAAQATLDQINDSLRVASSTPVSIGLGSKVFTVPTDFAVASGTPVRITSGANPSTQYMVGNVASYVGTTLTVTVSKFVGSGSYADWTIAVSGETGETGATGPSGSGSGDMLKSDNLSGLANIATARGNLGLGTAATRTLIDDDTFASATSTNIPSAESVKAYVDTELAGALGIEFWQGTPIAPSTNTVTSEAHTLSGTPDLFKLIAVCTSAELGYSVGDQIEVIGPHFNGSNNYAGFGLAVNSATVYIVHGIELTFRRKDTGAEISSINKAKWNLVARAWKF